MPVIGTRLFFDNLIAEIKSSKLLKESLFLFIFKKKSDF